MTTAWALTAQEICEDAFQHLGRTEAGDLPDASEMQLAMRALDAVLKELPLAGYTWPKLSDEVALAWMSGQTVALPADYFGSLAVWRTENGCKVFLAPIPHADWLTMTDRVGTGTPTQYYISPANVLFLYPVPSVDPGLFIQYQRIVDDALIGGTPNVPQYMLNALGYGVAHELSLKFAGDKPGLRQEIEARWMQKRAAALEYTTPPSQNGDYFTVAD